MEMRRTVPVVLDVDSDAAALLEDTVDTFLWSAQYVVDHAFGGEYVTTSKTKLDAETYDAVREQTEGFNGGLVQAARNKATEACKGVVARWKQGKKASKPRFTSPHVVYDHRTATFHDEYVSLATTAGRVEADYVLPDEDSDTPHAAYLFSDEYETTGAELHSCEDEWVLHVHCKTDVAADTPEQTATANGTVLGVYLGVTTLAVTSTGTFWSGDEFDHWRQSTRRGVATSSSAGHAGRTRISSPSVAKRLVASHRCCIASATSSSRKPVRTADRSSRSRT